MAGGGLSIMHVQAHQLLHSAGPHLRVSLRLRPAAHAEPAGGAPNVGWAPANRTQAALAPVRERYTTIDGKVQHCGLVLTERLAL